MEEREWCPGTESNRRHEDFQSPATAHWALTGEEWTAFIAEATSISIAATSELRGSAWGDQPFVAAPEWARASMPIHASAELPLEVRESLPSITSFLDSISASGVQRTTYWEADTLALLGSETGGAGDKVMAARFHALPFAEPATGLVYARARWFDPRTGSFLSPDPMGYRDSSNLYAFGGGDPVNGRDPRGLATVSKVVTDAYGLAADEALNPSNSPTERTMFGALALLTAPLAGAEQVVNALVDTPFRVWRNSGGLTHEMSAAVGADDDVSRVLHASAALGHASELLLDAAVVTGAVESTLARTAEKQLLRRNASRPDAPSSKLGESHAPVATQTGRPQTVSVYNARTDKKITQSVLNNIDPTMLPPNTRFGPAVYLAEQGPTAVLEVQAHGGTATHVIRYELRVDPARVLDLTQPEIASRWGYVTTASTTDYAASQALAQRAVQSGYNVIRYPAVRGPGANYAVIDDFGDLLAPQNVSPVGP